MFFTWKSNTVTTYKQTYNYNSFIKKNKPQHRALEMKMWVEKILSHYGMKFSAPWPNGVWNVWTRKIQTRITPRVQRFTKMPNHTHSNPFFLTFYFLLLSNPHFFSPKNLTFFLKSSQFFHTLLNPNCFLAILWRFYQISIKVLQGFLFNKEHFVNLHLLHKNINKRPKNLEYVLGLKEYKILIGLREG